MFYYAKFFVLLNLMHYLIFSQWPLALPMPLCTLTDYYEIIHFPASASFSTQCRVLPLQMPCAIIFSFPLFFLFHFYHLCLLLPHFCLSLLIESNSYMSLILSNTACCAHCAPTLWAHVKTCSLFTLLVSLRPVSSFIVLAIIVSLFRPLINWSFSLLSYSWYIQCAALIFSLPIHCWADSHFFFPVYNTTRTIWFWIFHLAW